MRHTIKATQNREIINKEEMFDFNSEKRRQSMLHSIMVFTLRSGIVSPSVSREHCPLLSFITYGSMHFILCGAEADSVFLCEKDSFYAAL